MDRKMNFPCPEYANRDVRSTEAYSSCLVGPGAKGTIVVFNGAALGHPVLRIGEVPDTLFPTHIPLTTNLTRVGSLGPCIGDLLARSLRIDFIGGSLPSIQRILEHATYKLLVSAKVQAAGGLRDLPATFDMPLTIGRSDTLDLLLTFDSCLEITQSVLVRFVLSGTAISDVR